MFRILVVDDDPAAAYLLREVMKQLKREHELSFVKDGVEALDFLNRRGSYEHAPRPDIILLDVHLPRLSGLETLIAIKDIPGLRVIPVIMLSTSSSPEIVRSSYEAHANCYVQKPFDLERFVKLVQALEIFWMDFALLESSREYPQTTDSEGKQAITNPSDAHSGPTIAQEPGEARSRAMSSDVPAKETATRARSSGCEEHNSLLDGYGAAVQELLKLHQQQFQAIVEGDTECNRFDILIHMANEKKHLAKYAYLRHVESHGCSNMNAFDKTRT
jgi:chemotaxis family two-component system response regulator Rcp1